MPRKPAASPGPAVYTVPWPQSVVLPLIDVAEGRPLRDAFGRGNAASEAGTPMYFGRPLPLEVPRALKLDANGRLANRLGTEGVFRLCPESADEILWLDWI